MQVFCLSTIISWDYRRPLPLVQAFSAVIIPSSLRSDTSGRVSELASWQWLIETSALARLVSNGVCTELRYKGPPSSLYSGSSSGFLALATSEALVNCHLLDFLKNPDLDLLNHFYPCHPTKTEPYAKIHPVMIQVNVFDCFGIVIGMCLSHKILDGISTSGFSKLPMDSITGLGRSMVRIGNYVKRRFLFDAFAIATLKSKITMAYPLQFPSHVEVVSTFIWKHIVFTLEVNLGVRRPFILSHAVDLRRRMIPPLGEFSMGNVLWIPSTICLAEDEMELNSLVRKLRDTITEINGDFVKRLQSGEWTFSL
ncbi:hypothetical protein Acr_00g0017280 [Actinidia rufa]|uniref:HXXXD-type acyl-transferase family protein n=1 Tax=Actinidia rufa TaxID=165716 RepID=A0A7J0DBE2_9ERIC|nr:hypothetical protein Acr_00g0017280 [Actinidia rufa]